MPPFGRQRGIVQVWRPRAPSELKANCSLVVNVGGLLFFCFCCFFLTQLFFLPDLYFHYHYRSCFLLFLLNFILFIDKIHKVREIWSEDANTFGVGSLRNRDRRSS